ncbi:MAG: sugar transferase [Pseudomonadota bacterium]
MVESVESSLHRRSALDVDARVHAAGLGDWAYRAWGKRLTDLILVLLATPIVLPAIALLAILVAVDSGRPFYAQTRVGRGGRSFTMWKLRTMVADADARLARHLADNPAAAMEWEHRQKLRCDPRVTRLGAFLRATSLDELPQLWNVLMGDMSLVGPRPIMENQRALYSGRAYYALRPGVTGPWQVSDRNNSDFSARVGHDDAYLATMSLGSDMELMLRTVHVVLGRTGC